MKPVLLAIAAFSFAACAQAPAVDLASIRKEFSDLLNPSFEIASTATKGAPDLRELLLALRKEKAGKRRFDTVSSITYESPSKVRITFIWSGGMHGGVFTLSEKDRVWSVIDEAWLL